MIRQHQNAVRLAGLVAAVALVALAGAAPAQYPPLTTPQPSPAASISQTVGVTGITIDYSRPMVNGRKVWGELVPYGQVWRAGANVNTRVTFSTPVAVDGHPLAAGSYGLHMIPATGKWTVIFSKDADQWGSFSYDEKHDALRIEVVPGTAPMTEALRYTIEPLSNESAEIVMDWETARVAIPLTVDTKAETVVALRRDLTGLAQFFWQPWNAAANYCITNNVDLDEAADWLERSIAINANFTNASTKAKLLRLRGDDKGADALIATALRTATEAEVNLHGYTLMNAGNLDQALVMFRKNVKDHPESWNVYDSLGEALDKAGKKSEAITNYRKALAMAPAAQKGRIEGILKTLDGKS
ncbi:MAG: DUF2911 domain-containing protein [Thermoanaerobaculia bacterium]